MKKKMLAAIVVLALAAVLSPLFAQSQGECLRILIDPGKDEVVLNPYTASDSNSIIIMQNLYDGLFEYDPVTSEARPALATDYEISEDGLLWTFHLREARFSDVTKITSRTFADSWNYMTGGPLASNLDFVARLENGKLDIETPDDSTLVVKLRYSVPYLPSLLCQPCLAAIKDTTSYSGAFILQSQSDEEIRLGRNPYYWDAVNVEQVEIRLGSATPDDFLSGKVQCRWHP